MILLGAPGVGKGTQAELSNQRLLACHLSTGEVFRSSATRSVAEQSPAMKEALVHIRQGELVPDRTVWEMVREHGECLHCAGGFVLAGFPRTVAQPVLLEQFLDQDLLTALIACQLRTSNIVARLGGRGTSEKCKSLYHMTERPPKAEGRLRLLRRQAVSARR